MKRFTWWVFSLVSLSYTGIVISDGWDPASLATNTDSIANTRHNLTVSYNQQAALLMSGARNDYVEICVYCHTPHGANSQLDAPLWNRTFNNGTYQIFDKARTLNRPIGQPSPNSLTCLSCHDGTIAIDSILNMPGSGGWGNNQGGTSDQAFLDTWVGGNRGADGPIPGTNNHLGLGNTDIAKNGANPTGTCGACHCNGPNDVPPEAVGSACGTPFDNAPSFYAFMLGTDLRDDHPIGIQFPEADYAPTQLESVGVDFHEPFKGWQNGSGVPMWFFDTNGNQAPDKTEPRLYNTGENFEVECASCHDPHGVPTAGQGSEFLPSFLRVSNGNVNTGDTNASGLCLTCHTK